VFTALTLGTLRRLWQFDRGAAAILSPYVIWLAYDLAWAWGLYRLNVGRS
jgi:tryptophan-rich sensory protein